MQNERKMLKMNHLDAFNAEMYGYILLDHAEEVPEAEISSGKYYLPVKGVIKENSTSTKIRPVFDASAKSTNGTSLNDLYLIGPNLYPLIFDILLKFREHKIAMAGDISKMYREVKLEDCDKDFHRMFVRHPDGRIVVARMKRLTFGVRPSPFIATSVIRYHAAKHKESYPEASEAILSSFYVDDFLSGASTLEEAQHIRESLCELLGKCGMVLRKWRSSSKELLQSIPEELIEKEDRKELIRGDALRH